LNKGKNFPSFQMLSACWVIGKIRVRYAAGGGLVAVKGGAVNASSSLKITLQIPQLPYSCPYWLVTALQLRMAKKTLFPTVPSLLLTCWQAVA
jgi:hypothetical protein